MNNTIWGRGALSRPLRQLAAALVVLVGLVSPALAGTMTIDFLDVGQGDAIVIQSPDGKVVVVDAGPGKADIVTELTRRGITKVDLLVASHPHLDHIGGMVDILRSMPVGYYIDSGIPHTTQAYTNLMKTLEELETPYQTAELGQKINVGEEVVLHVLWPGPVMLRGTRSDPNSNSVVLRVEHKGNCVLLPGDAEPDTEVRLVMNQLEPCQVLKVPHHGGNHSSTDRFLDTLKPEYAIIMVGGGNRYGHPGKDTLARLAKRDIMVYRTDLSGTLRLISDDDGVEILEGMVAVAPGVAAPPPEPLAQLAASQDQGAATQAGPAKAAPDVVPVGPRFVASKSREVFHTPDCQWAKKISPRNMVTYDSYEEAELDGKRPAGCCNPQPDEDHGDPAAGSSSARQADPSVSEDDGAQDPAAETPRRGLFRWLRKGD